MATPTSFVVQGAIVPPVQISPPTDQPKIQNTIGVSTTTSPELLNQSLIQAHLAPASTTVISPTKPGQVLPIETDLATINAIRSSQDQIQKINRDATFQLANQTHYQSLQPVSRFVVAAGPAKIAGPQVISIPSSQPQLGRPTYPVISSSTPRDTRSQSTIMEPVIDKPATPSLLIKSPSQIGLRPTPKIQPQLTIKPAPQLQVALASKIQPQFITPTIQLQSTIKPAPKIQPQFIIKSATPQVVFTPSTGKKIGPIIITKENLAQVSLPGSSRPIINV